MKLYLLLNNIFSISYCAIGLSLLARIDEKRIELKEKGELSAETAKIVDQIFRTRAQISAKSQALSDIEASVVEMAMEEEQAMERLQALDWTPDYSPTPTDNNGRKGPPRAPIGRVDPQAIVRRKAKAVFEARMMEAKDQPPPKQESVKDIAADLRDIWNLKAALNHYARMLSKSIALKEEAYERLISIASIRLHLAEATGPEPISNLVDDFGFQQEVGIRIANDYAGNQEEDEWEHSMMSSSNPKSLSVEVISDHAWRVCGKYARMDIKVMKVVWDANRLKDYSADQPEFYNLKGCHLFVSGKPTGFILRSFHYNLSDYCVKREPNISPKAESLDIPGFSIESADTESESEDEPGLHPNLQGQRIIGKQIGFQFEICQLYEASVLVVELRDTLLNGVDREVYIEQYLRYAKIFADSGLSKIVIAYL